MTDMLKEFIKITNNEFASIAEDGAIVGDIETWIDTGSYVFNALMCGDIFGGMPNNKIIGIGADHSQGKTFFALCLAKNFLDKNKDGIVIYFESEGALTKKTLIERGIDTTRFGIFPVATVQEFKNQALKIIDAYEKKPKDERKPMFIILDSLGMLSTTKEMEDSLQGAETQDMTRAKLIKAAFRILTLKLSKVNIPLFVTNHVYADMSGGLYAQKVLSGGTGLTYAASIIFTLTKAKDKDQSSGEIKGAVITITVAKGRLVKEFTKGKCLIKYDGGLDRYYGLLELAEEAGVFKKTSTRYELPDGSKVFGKTINENPEKYFTPEILEQINQYVKEKFCYGMTSENHENSNSNNDEFETMENENAI